MTTAKRAFTAETTTVDDAANAVDMDDDLGAPDVTVTGARISTWRIAIVTLRIVVGRPVVASCGLVVVLLAIVIGVVAVLVAGHAGPNLAHRAIGSVLQAVPTVIELAAIVLVAPTFAEEYRRGTIRASLAVVPRRGMFFAGRLLGMGLLLVILGSVIGVVSGGAVFVTVAVRGGIFPAGVVAEWLTSVAGITVATVLFGLACQALGALTRNTVAAVVVPLVALYLLPLAVALLRPERVARTVAELLPGPLVEAVVQVRSPASSWMFAALALTMWTAFAVILAAVRVVRDDVTQTRGGTSRGVLTQPRRHRVDGARVKSLTAWRLLASEARKLIDVPSLRIIAVLSVALHTASGLLILLTFGGTRHASAATLNMALFSGSRMVPLFLAAAVAVAVAGEFGSGQAQLTRISVARPYRVVAAKTVALGVAAVGLAIASLATTLLAVALVFAADGIRFERGAAEAISSAAASTILTYLLTSIFAAGIAGILRRRAGAVLVFGVITMLAPIALNGLLPFAQHQASALLPVANAANFFPGVITAGGGGFQGSGTPLIWQTGDGALFTSHTFFMLVLAAWAVLALAFWFLLDRKRPVVVT